MQTHGGAMALRQSDDPDALVRLTVQVTRAQKAKLVRSARESHVSLAIVVRQILRTALDDEQAGDGEAA